MYAYLYRHWAPMCLPLALYVTLVLWAGQHGMAPYDLWVWLQFPVYLIHQFEEHAWPGGFKQFVNGEVFKVTNRDAPLDDRSIFWINVPLIWIFFPLCALLSQFLSPHIGVLLAVIGVFNATTHLITTLVKRKYNPGLWVSLLLNYPTGIYTLYLAHQAHLLDAWTLSWSIALTVLIHAAIIIYALAKMRAIGSKGS